MSAALSPFSVRLILCGLLLASAIGLGLKGRRLGLGRWFETFAVAILVGAALWLPDYLRTPVATLLATLIFSLGAGLAPGILTGALVFALAYFLVPGGGTVLVLGILACIAIGVVTLSARRLRRMARAFRLTPGVAPDGDVELGGIALAIRPLSPPGVELSCLLYRASPWAEGQVASHEPFAIRSAEGLAVIEPSGAELDLEGKKRTLSAEEARTLLGFSAELPTPKGGGGPGDLAYLEEGSACYVVGVPVWEPASAELVARAANALPEPAGYRGAPTVPVFRSTPEHRLYLADRPEDSVRHETLFNLWAWSSWGVLWVGVAVLQALRLA